MTVGRSVTSGVRRQNDRWRPRAGGEASGELTLQWRPQGARATATEPGRSGLGARSGGASGRLEHRGPGGVHARGPGRVCGGQLRGRGNPQKVLSRRKLDPLAPCQAHPGCVQRMDWSVASGEAEAKPGSVTAVAGKVTGWDQRGSSGQ